MLEILSLEAWKRNRSQQVWCISASKLMKYYMFGSKIFLQPCVMRQSSAAKVETYVGNVVVGSVEAITSVSYNTEATCVHATCVGNVVVGSVEAYLHIFCGVCIFLNIEKYIEVDQKISKGMKNYRFGSKVFSVLRMLRDVDRDVLVHRQSSVGVFSETV